MNKRILPSAKKGLEIKKRRDDIFPPVARSPSPRDARSPPRVRGGRFRAPASLKRPSTPRGRRALARRLARLQTRARGKRRARVISSRRVHSRREEKRISAGVSRTAPPRAVRRVVGVRARPAKARARIHARLDGRRGPFRVAVRRRGRPRAPPVARAPRVVAGGGRRVRLLGGPGLPPPRRGRRAERGRRRRLHGRARRVLHRVRGRGRPRAAPRRRRGRAGPLQRGRRGGRQNISKPRRCVGRLARASSSPTWKPTRTSGASDEAARRERAPPPTPPRRDTRPPRERRCA